MQDNLIPIKPVSKDLLYMKVADEIYNYIHINKLQPGAKISSERVLAERLHTGRNSVREALRILENERIIEVKTGRGAFVMQSASPGSIYLKLMKINYLELLKIKTILEREAIKEITNRITPDQINQLEKLLVTLEKAAQNNIYSTEDDTKFHNKLLGYSQNKMMVQMIDEIRKALDDYAIEFKDTHTIWISTIPYHREMLTAIQNGDVAGACQAHNKIYETDISLFNQIAYIKDEPNPQFISPEI